LKNEKIVAASNIGLITAYSTLVLKHKRFTAVMLAVPLTIYALLFSLLKSQDYALFFGSVASFVALAVTIFLTRNVNWYRK
jgi:inner membrane protein